MNLNWKSKIWLAPDGKQVSYTEAEIDLSLIPELDLELTDQFAQEESVSRIYISRWTKKYSFWVETIIGIDEGGDGELPDILEIRHKWKDLPINESITDGLIAEFIAFAVELIYPNEPVAVDTRAHLNEEERSVLISLDALFADER